jgi:hypothetical protein
LLAPVAVVALEFDHHGGGDGRDGRTAIDDGPSLTASSSNGTPSATPAAPSATPATPSPNCLAKKVLSTIGDSIMKGYGLTPTDAWPELISATNGWELTSLAC